MCGGVGWKNMKQWYIISKIRPKLKELEYQNVFDIIYQSLILEKIKLRDDILGYKTIYIPLLCAVVFIMFQKLE